MARVNISEAAKLAGITRSYLYSKYINKGLVSVATDNDGKKYIETSEILRVFGKLKEDTEDNTVNRQEEDTVTQPDTELFVTLGELKVETKHLKEQLAASQEREAFYQKQITELTGTIKLLKGPEQPKYPRLWWQFWK